MAAPALIGRNSPTVAFLLLCSAYVNECVGFSHQKRISVNLGLSDAEAVVGKIFRYTIPKDAFNGDVAFYEVTEAGGTMLQNWLVWYPQTYELVGVPSEQDSGPNYVQVTAIAINADEKDEANYTANKSTRANDRAKDIFSISVNDEYRLPVNRIAFDERMTCEDGSATTMTLIFATSFDVLTTPEKVALIQKVSNAFAKNEGAFRLFSNNDDGFSSLKRIIHLASAPANAVTEETGDDQGLPAGSEAVVTWRTNCDSQIPTKGNDSTLDWLLAAESQSGYLRKIWSYPVASWYVASITYDPRRRRRQASYVTPDSYIGATGPTWAVDVTVSNVPTRSPLPTRTPTIRIRPTGFITTQGIDWTSITSSSSRRPVTTTPSTPVGSTTIATSIRTRPTTDSTSRTSMAGTIATFATKKPGDARPTLKNSLGTLNCRQNVVCDIAVPPDTFHDTEDGDTGKLKLRLDALGDAKKQPAWLYLDESRQHLLGLPVQTGKFLFRLTATDSGNRHMSDAFSVDIAEDPVNEEKLTHRIFIYFTVPDEKNFTSDVKYRILLLQKLAQYFGDRMVKNIRVNSLSENGFVLSWSNVSLPVDRCPRSELRAIMNRLLLPDGQVRAQFKRFMEPAFIIQKSHIEYSGTCSETTKGVQVAPAAALPTAPAETTNGTMLSVTTSVVTSSASQDHFFISTILPAVIIALLLIVATLVACILYRRNRQHKKGRAESKSEFVSKGAPVIFPDEVDLDKESTAATPMLLKDEKPPLQPLDFSGAGGAVEMPHGNGTGNGAPMVRSPLIAKPPSMGPGRVLGKTHVSEAETELWQKPLLQDTDDNPLYRPPPAFEPAGVKENRSPRPKHASPQQRDPPPYVPP